jgi:hypothetical protein
MLKMTNEAENTKLMREVELLKGLNHVRKYSSHSHLVQIAMAVLCTA